MKRHLGISTVLLVISSCVPAIAQSVDYSTAEQLFNEPVTTAATGKPQRVSDAPTNMEIITAEQIRHSGADNIPDVLRYVAGIDVRRYGQLDTSVGIRGFNTAINARVLVLLDGRQVYEDDYGFVPWALIPVALRDIRQIEVIKGPSAALYGFNAVSGVINIVTYDPLRDKVNGATAEGGTQGRGYGEGVATAQIPGRLGVRLSAEGFRSDEFAGVGPTGIQTPTAGSAAFDARTQVTPNVEWDVSGSAGTLSSNYVVDLGSYTPLNDQAYSLRSRVLADTDYGLLGLDAFCNQNIPKATIFIPLTWRERVCVARASDVFKVGSAHTIRVGVEYRNNEATSDQFYSGTLRDQVAAASVMWEWQLTPQVDLTNAVRVDALQLSHDGPQFEVPLYGGLYHGETLVEPSFNSGLVWKPTDQDTVRLIAARAVQLPSLIDFGLSANLGSAILVGNPALQPAALTNFEVDYDRQVAFLPATLRLAAFAQRQDLSIGAPFGSGVSFLPTYQALLAAQNFGGSHEIGGEIGIRGTTAFGLRWNASYALADVHDDTPEATLITAPSVNYAPQTPVHAVIVGAGYTWQRFDLDVQARWQSDFLDYRFDPYTLASVPVRVPNYVTFDAHAAYHITDQITASVTALQANAPEEIQTAGVPVERRIFGTIKADF